MSIEVKLNSGHTVMLDHEDWELLKDYRWRISSNNKIPYVRLEIKQPDGKWRARLLHRMILNAPDGKVVDHINNDTLDNRRVNLRLCTGIENSKNLSKTSKPTSSKYKGVSLIAGQGKWQATIRINGKNKNLGTFSDEAIAAITYDKYAIELHGNFARTNFPASIIAGFKND